MKKLLVYLLFMMITAPLFGQDALDIFGKNKEVGIHIDCLKSWTLHCSTSTREQFFSLEEPRKEITIKGSGNTFIPIDDTLLISKDVSEGIDLFYDLQSDAMFKTISLFIEDQHGLTLIKSVAAVGAPSVKLLYLYNPE